jgi:nitrite reductase/ring-hydroxylating ferredoxin subunit
MLRARLTALAELPHDQLAAIAIPELTWPVLAGIFDGEVIATAGVCPHEDVSLAEGTVGDCRLTCPGHGYQFDLRTGECLHDASLVLRRYRVTIIDTDVWIDLL